MILNFISSILSQNFRPYYAATVSLGNAVVIFGGFRSQKQSRIGMLQNDFNLKSFAASASYSVRYGLNMIFLKLCSLCSKMKNGQKLDNWTMLIIDWELFSWIINFLLLAMISCEYFWSKFEFETLEPWLAMASKIKYQNFWTYDFSGVEVYDFKNGEITFNWKASDYPAIHRFDWNSPMFIVEDNFCQWKNFHWKDLSNTKK